MDFCAKTPGIHFVCSPLTKPYAPGLRIETGTPARKQAFEIAAADHLLGRKAVERGRIDQRNGVAERKRNIKVMGREEDAFPLVAGQAPQQRRQFVAVRQVEEGRGFVEQNDRGVLGQRPGDHHPLAFAVRHPVQGLACECGHPHQVERTLHDGPVAVLHPPDPVGVGGPAQRNDIFAREVGNPHLVGGHERDRCGALPGCQFRQGVPAELHAARCDGPQSGNGPQQGAFARSVATDQGRQGARGERGADAGEQRAAAVGKGDLFEKDAHRFRRGCGCG